MNKHADLIVAYDGDKLLACFLRAIDDERNDILVHIDFEKKTTDVI